MSFPLANWSVAGMAYGNGHSCRCILMMGAIANPHMQIEVNFRGNKYGFFSSLGGNLGYQVLRRLGLDVYELFATDVPMSITVEWEDAARYEVKDQMPVFALRTCIGNTAQLCREIQRRNLSLRSKL